MSTEKQCELNIGYSTVETVTANSSAVAGYWLDELGVSSLSFLLFHYINVKSSATANSTEHYPRVILQPFFFLFINKMVNLSALPPNLWHFFSGILLILENSTSLVVLVNKLIDSISNMFIMARE